MATTPPPPPPLAYDTTAATSCTSSSEDNDDNNNYHAQDSSSSSRSSPLPRLIPALPDDLTLQILARLPPSSHPTLSLVSRSFRSLLLHHNCSPLFSTRHHLLHLSQPFLCLSLRSPSSHFFYLLLHSHSPISSFVPLPPPPLPTLGSACASHGSLLFLLGGSLRDLPSPSLQTLDLRLRRWSLGPPMSTPRHFPAAAILRRRLYVLGGCHPSSSSSFPHYHQPWAESLDLDRPSSVWSPLPDPPSPLRHRWMHGCAAASGRVLAVADRGGVAYDPATGEWAPVPPALDLGWKGRVAVVGGLICSYDFLGRIKGYDPEGDRWMEVEGLGRRLPRFLAGASMADLGGRLCVVWEGKGGRGSREVELCFAGIDLERLGEGRLKGEVAWLESAVLPLPRGSTITHCVSVWL